MLACFLVRERAVDRTQPVQGGPVATAYWITTIVRDVEYVALSVSLFFVYMGMLIPFYYIPMRATYDGIDREAANNFLPICYAASFVGRIATGFQADHIGRDQYFSLPKAKAL